MISIIALVKTEGLSQMSALFPQIIASILLGCSVIYLIVSLIKPTHDKAFEGLNGKRIITFLAGLCLYVLLIWIVGFLISSILMLGFFIWFLQGDKFSTRRRVIFAGGCSIGITVVFYVLFKVVFLVPLPPGLFFS